MKAKLFLIVAITIAIFGCQMSTPLTEFVSEEGNFSVMMPGTPTEESESTAEGIDIHMFSAESGSTAYVVGYSDFPQEIIDVTDPEMLLGFAQDGAVGSGALISEAPITLNGYPGKDLKFEEASEGLIIYARIYLVDNRLYQVIATTEDSDMPTEISEFLDSFKLLQ